MILTTTSTVISVSHFGPSPVATFSRVSPVVEPSRLASYVSQISTPFTIHSRVASIFDEIAVSPGAFTLIEARNGFPSGGQIGIKSRCKYVSNVYSVPFISISSGAARKAWINKKISRNANENNS